MHAEGVQPSPIFKSVTRQSDSQTGAIEGVFNLPVKGVWLVRFGFFVPGYSQQAYLNAIFPTESVESVAEGDTIEVNLNGRTEIHTTTPQLQGHKEFVEYTVEGMQLRYAFKFTSSKIPRVVHPFVTPAEITLERDSALPPTPSSETGTLDATAVNAVDGKKLNIGRKLSNGYVENSWTIETNPKLLIFQGSTLVRETSFSGGRLSEDLPVGDFSCIGILHRFYAFFMRRCTIGPGTNYLGNFPFSPVLNPGNTRIVLEWGATPSDLDSYLSVPALPSNPGPPCQLWYRNKKCNAGTIMEVNLDLDALSHSTRGGLPETITFGLIQPGKYVFWSNEYRGRNAAALVNSGASVAFYSEEFQQRFMVGRDGYINGLNWYVFYIDGDTKTVHPCDPSTCP